MSRIGPVGSRRVVPRSSRVPERGSRTARPGVRCRDLRLRDESAGGFDGVAAGESFRYESDYVVRGEADRCGPSYGTQIGVVTCEWFVHEFPDGLPDGHWAIWSVWEAPCRAWVGLGSISSCTDPHEVMALFSSGVDSPFDPHVPSYDEPRGGFHAAGEPDPDL